ncbi:hypothetical protein GEOBRER4_n2781 [Citrifermentans bremense]|uniref:Uncharacterized protein n=1 Tax=Citrifermentans bremense TaxID=60035 RepID=A0A7R7IYW2_9BACT|nr:hypothetical protein GEOBRER4_n2781 [Citrifermentans bremense]
MSRRQGNYQTFIESRSTVKPLNSSVYQDKNVCLIAFLMFLL